MFRYLILLFFKDIFQLIQILANYFGLPIDTRIERATKQYNSMDCGMFVIEFSRHYVEVC